MISSADTIGVFQVESRAQMSMLPRLRPRCYYDLVIEVAIVRPGPIQGKMVHPYLKRRKGEAPVEYASPEIERVLGRTLGVPLFQEQAMSLAVVAAGFTPGEADQLRRAMASWKRSGDAIRRFEHKLIGGMIDRGHTPEFARQVFTQISGFSGYGFPESHAASFALLVYASAWLKRHHPAAFAAALLNSQPMGFYQPAQIVRDARDHGVEVRGVDVLESGWDCELESQEGQRDKGTEGQREEGRRSRAGLSLCPSVPSSLCPSSSWGAHGPALRLGMRLVKGLAREDADKIAAAVREHGRFRDVARLWRVSGCRASALRRLAGADAFASMGLTRQRALWTLARLSDERLPLFEAAGLADPHTPEASAPLPAIPAADQTAGDYHATGLSLKAHPVSFLRDRLDAEGVLRARDLASAPDRSPARVAGIVLVRQRPGTASGIVFITVEDETGAANLIVRPKVYERFRRAARHSPMIVCAGRVERQGQVVHIVARTIRPLAGEPLLRSRDFH